MTVAPFTSGDLSDSAGARRGHLRALRPLFLDDRAYTLSATGRGRTIGISDTVFDPEAPVPAYGRRGRLGSFICVSRWTGFTCRMISRQRRRTF